MASIKAAVEASDGALEVKKFDWSRRLVRAGTDELWTPAGIDGLGADVAAYQTARRRELATLLGLGEDVSEETLAAQLDDATTVFRCDLTCKMGGLRADALLDHRCQQDVYSAPLPVSGQPLDQVFQVHVEAKRTIKHILVNACIDPDERKHSKLAAIGAKFVLTAVRSGWVAPNAADHPYIVRQRFRLYKPFAWSELVRLRRRSSADRPADGSLHARLSGPLRRHLGPSNWRRGTDDRAQDHLQQLLRR